MLRRILTVSCITILAIVIGLTWYVKEEELSQLQKEHEKANVFQEDMLNEAYYIQFKNWDLQFDSLRNITLKSSDNKSNSLYNLVKPKTFIFYFSSNMCSQCVEKTLIQFSNLIENHKLENYILIAEGFRSDYFFKEESLKSWRSNAYLSEESIFYRDHALETPVILYMREARIIQTVFVTPKNLSRFHELFNKSLNQ